MSGTKWNVNSMIAGAGGGLVASVATCPLDVVKTRLQAQRYIQGSDRYKGIWATTRSIIVQDGLRGMYRGLGPTILGYLPTWAIYFSVYDGIKQHFGEGPMSETNKPMRMYPAPSAKGYQPVMREHPWSLHILSAMSAGATSTICTNPLWVIKTRFMTQSRREARYRHTLDAALTIYRTEGISAFYRGLFPSLLGITHVAVQFPLYEKLKVWAQGNSNEPLSTKTILLCSAIAKMTASVATYPHEVVRTRMQTQRRLLSEKSPSPLSPISTPSPATASTSPTPSNPSELKPTTKHGGLIYTTKHMIKTEGWATLYRGLSINLFRTVPNSAVTMLTYELLMRYLSARTNRLS